MLFVCFNCGIFAEEKTSTSKNVSKSQVKKKVKKKKTSKSSKKGITKKTVVKNDSLQPSAAKKHICSDSLVVRAKSHLGTHYKYASCVPSAGFDCSGFVYHLFSTFDVKVPRSSIDYGSLPGSIPSDSAQVGDVIVFTGTNAKIRRAGHVGIVISNPGDELTFIHSSSNTKHGGVIISTYKSSPYYKNRFLKIVRLENVVVGNCN